jgi:hypothetical protein
VFDAPDAPELDATRLSSLQPSEWEHARIVTLPALRLLWVRYPVARLRRELIQTSNRSGALDGLQVPTEERATGLIVYRDRQRVVREQPLTELQAALFEGLQARLPLLDACQAAVDRVPSGQPTLEAEVGAWFAKWARLGWLVDVDV